MPLPGSGRITVNTNGTVPLANVGSGAPGTLTGTERGKLQNFPATANSANVVSTIVARDANGDFAGRNITAAGVFSGNLSGNATTATSATTATTATTATAANALNNGTTDGDKLHRLGTVLTAALASNLATSGPSQVLTIGLPAGQWLVTGNIVTTLGGSANARFDGSAVNPLGTGLVPLTAVNTSGADRAASLPGVVFQGVQNVYLDIYQSGTSTVYGGTSVFGGSPASNVTWMQAVCVG